MAQAMTVFETYQDLVDEINLYLIRVRQYRMERKLLLYSISGPAGYGSGTSLGNMGIRGTANTLTMEDVVIRIERIEHNLVYCQDMLELLQSQKQEIDNKLSTLEGNKYKVFYLHRIKNMTFKQVAVEIGKSESQVSRIYKEVMKV